MEHLSNQSGGGNFTCVRCAATGLPTGCCRRSAKESSGTLQESKSKVSSRGYGPVWKKMIQLPGTNGLAICNGTCRYPV